MENNLSKPYIILESNNTKIKGDLILHGFTQINCEIQGTITTTGECIIKKLANIKAKFKGTTLTIYGKFSGEIETDKLIIKSGAIVNAKIKTNILIVDEGAILNIKTN